MFFNENCDVEEFGGMNVVFVFKDGWVVIFEFDSIFEGIMCDLLL